MGSPWLGRGLFSRVKRSVQQPPFPTLAIACIFIVALTVVSAILSMDPPSQILPATKWPHWESLIAGGLAFLLGGLSGVFLSGVGQVGWKESVSCFSGSILRTGYLFVVLVVVFVSGMIWFFSAWVNTETKKYFLNFHDPGGVFAAWMGLITIVGFAFTLHDLREMRRRITTFPDLIDRLTAMLLRARRGKDSVHFLAYTPALGYIALEDEEFRSFDNALHDRGSGLLPPVDMVCLSKEGLEEWHNLFIGRRTRRKNFGGASGGAAAPTLKPAKRGVVDPSLAQAATDEGEAIVRNLVNESRRAKEEPRVKRLPFEFLPGYYFFVSSDRAIVVAPLQLPFPKGAPRKDDKERGEVQMLGFETNDRSIIRDLKRTYESYKDLPSSYIAEKSKSISPAEFEGWCNGTDSDFCRGQIQELFEQYKVAKGPDAPTVSDEKMKTLYEDYKDYLSPQKLARTTLELTFRLSLKEEAHEP